MQNPPPPPCAITLSVRMPIGDELLTALLYLLVQAAERGERCPISISK